MIYYLNIPNPGEDYQIIKLVPPWVELILESYVPHNSLVISDTVIDHFLDNYDSFDMSRYSCVIFNLSINPVRADYFLPKINQTKLGVRHYILTGLFDCYHNETTARFFPFWAVWSSLQTAPMITNTRNYKLSCLNGTPWTHRKLSYLALSKKPYFNNMVFTFNNRPYHHPFGQDQLTDDEQLEFNRLKDNVCFLEADASIGIDTSVNHPAYLDSYVNFVTETTVREGTPMLSEKSFKPILSQQLMVLFACPGSVAFLRKIGIDMFDDVIDHSYDTIVDTRLRLNQALAQVDRLMSMDLAQLHLELLPRLQKNSTFFTSDEFRKQFLVKLEVA